MRALLTAILVLASSCGEDAPELTFTAVTFNTGTTDGLPHDDPPDDGYDQEDAVTSDTYYGNGLAWVPAIDDTRAFLTGLQPDLIVFQEIFHPGACPGIPEDARASFICERWTDGDPTVAQEILGAGYQVACHLGKPDKCAAVKKSFGSFRGCEADLCLEGLDGAEVDGCGSGSRVGRGVIELAAGGALTLVNIHGSSGLSADDMDCRTRQVEQVFVDLGDGAPAASGDANVVMGDFNTDPGRFAGSDPSAARVRDFAGETGDDAPFTFASDVGEDAAPTYSGAVNIDHVISDVFRGDCWAAGLGDHPPVTEAVYFDHLPIVCTLEGDLP